MAERMIEVGGVELCAESFGDAADPAILLTLISSSPALPTGRELPPPAEEFGRFFSTVRVDWSDADSVIEYLVAYTRVLAGGRRPFDEAEARDLACRDVARARDFSAARNHGSIPDGDRQWGPLSSIATPTLVIHGTSDPMFPPGHDRALAEEIPGARLLTLPGAGHGVERADWTTIASAILDHTDR